MCDIVCDAGGRWAAGLAGCGVGRCWRWAAGCCEVWQGWQAVGAVQVGQGWRWCVVIVGGGLLLAWSSGAALAVLILPGAGGGRNIQVLRPALPGYFPAFPRGGTTPSACRAADPAGRAGGKAAQKKKARAGGAVCAAALAFGLRWRGHLVRRWRCSIRCVFAVCRRGQILHFTG